MKHKKLHPTILLKPHHFIQLRLRRIAALFIDLMPIIIFQVLFEIMLFIFRDQINSPRSIPPQPYSDALVNIICLLWFTYFCFLSFQMSRGKFATLGMKLMKIRTITKSGNSPNFLNSIAHFFVMCISNFFVIFITFIIFEAMVSGNLRMAFQSAISTITVLSIILGICYIYTQPNHVKWMHKPYLQDFFSKLTFIRTYTKYSDT